MNHEEKAIVHVVTWRLNGKTEAEKALQAQKVVDAFEAIRGKIPGLVRMDVGANCIPASDAWDVALSMIFSNRANLQAYLEHPDHLAIKKIVGPIRSERGQADFEIQAN